MKQRGAHRYTGTFAQARIGVRQRASRKKKNLKRKRPLQSAAELLRFIPYGSREIRAVQNAFCAFCATGGLESRSTQ